MNGAEQTTERILTERRDVPWLPQGAIMQTTLTHRLPPRELVTSVFGLCFENDRLLMIMHEKRNSDIPGGHVETGESLEDALRREFQEEAAASICDLEVIGYVKITLPGSKPPDYRYPHPISYMVAFAGRVERLYPFKGEFETTERRLLSADDARKETWVSANRELYELARRKSAAK
jgi:8-oxo-dGTP diphosphatase